jgi:hypothetical protein
VFNANRLCLSCSVSKDPAVFARERPKIRTRVLQLSTISVDSITEEVLQLNSPVEIFSKTIRTGQSFQNVPTPFSSNCLCSRLLMVEEVPCYEAIGRAMEG